MSSPGLVMAFSSPVKFKPAHPPLRHRVQRQLRAPGGARAPRAAGFTFVPHASSGRASGAMGAAKSPQRSFSVMQSAMKIPGLASALNLIGVSGPGGGTASGDSTVAAAGSGANGGPPAPEDSSPQPIANQLDLSAGASSASRSGSEPTPAVASAGASASNTAAAAASAEVVYELAAAAASSNGNGNGHPPHSNHHPRTAPTTSVRHFNGHANGFGHLRGGSGGGGSDLDEPMSVVDPGSRTENNITPYTVGTPSLAGQIREIASTLRHINSLRLDYVDKISQQELELSAKDQVLRSKEERIQSLEQEAAELRRSMAMLHSAKTAAETEVQRLRAAAAAAAAAAPALNAAAALPPSSSPSPSPVTTATAAPATTAPSPAAPPPHPLTAPPAAVFASNPATFGAAPPAAAPRAVAPAPPPPRPPPPPRVPEIVVSYRSSWPDVFLHFNLEGRGWTAVPGVKMEHSGNREYTIRLQGRSLEFVLTNGQGEWDSPAGGGPGRNYRIDAPGEYRLNYGAVSQVKAWQP